MAFTLKQLQEEHRPWALHNFGPRPPHQPLLGMIEELGELDEASTTTDVEDAVADFVVFLTDFASQLDIDMARVEVNAQTRLGSVQDLYEAWSNMSRIAHHFLKMEQGIRGRREEHLAIIENQLELLLASAANMQNAEDVSDVHTWECLMSLVEKVWGKVKLRDFKANSLTGEAITT